MGSFEKLVVLTVIFLASVILAVAALSDGPEAPPAGNGGAALVAERETAPPAEHPADRSAGQAAPRSEPAASGTDARPNPFASGTRPARSSEDLTGAGLLSATGAAVDEAPAAPAVPLVATASDELPTLLATATGLVPSFDGSGTHFYTVGRDDRTWTGLSERFYGTATFAELLRSENAAVGQPVPGTLILVPSRSERTTASRTEPHGARAPGRPAPPAPKVGAGEPAPLPSELTGQTFRTHTVGRGESLTAIAHHYYGKSSLWKRIHDAHLDQLPDPDRLAEGMVLRIP
jgi:nucleoid-associated protein YgaU